MLYLHGKSPTESDVGKNNGHVQNKIHKFSVSSIRTMITGAEIHILSIWVNRIDR